MAASVASGSVPYPQPAGARTSDAPRGTYPGPLRSRPSRAPPAETRGPASRSPPARLALVLLGRLAHGARISAIFTADLLVLGGDVPASVLLPPLNWPSGSASHRRFLSSVQRMRGTELASHTRMAHAAQSEAMAGRWRRDCRPGSPQASRTSRGHLSTRASSRPGPRLPFTFNGPGSPRSVMVGVSLNSSFSVIDSRGGSTRTLRLPV